MMKKAFFTTLQLLVTLAVLYWVFRDDQKRAQMGEALRNADKTWILIAIGMYGVVEIIAAARFEILLRVQGIRIGWLRSAALVMIGVFFNLFMFGATGGDVVKVFYLLKETPGKKATAFLAVIMDRLVGLLALITMASVFIGLRYQWLAATDITRHLAQVLIFILAAGLLGIVMSFVITSFNLVHKLPSRMPFHDKMVELSAACNLYGRAWKTSLLALLLSIVAHLGYFGIFYCAARSLNAGVSALDFATIMPIVNTITAMPISVSGVGWREFLFEKLLGNLCGVPDAVAVLISSMGFLVVICCSLVGGLIYLLYRPSQHAGLSEIREEIGALESRIARSE